MISNHVEVAKIWLKQSRFDVNVTQYAIFIYKIISSYYLYTFSSCRKINYK